MVAPKKDIPVPLIGGVRALAVDVGIVTASPETPLLDNPEFKNAVPSIDVTSSGIVIDFNAIQPANARRPIVVSVEPGENVTVANEVQLLNDSTPIVASVEGNVNVIVCIDKQPSNALSLIVVTEAGIVIDVNAQPENA